jgi:cytochrome c
MKNAGKIGAFIAVLVLAGATANPSYVQDAEHGKTIFKACAAGHAIDQANRLTGPGRNHRQEGGHASRLRYSNAMKNSDIVWEAKILDAYLESPQKVVPGNKMPYPELNNPTDRTDLVADLATLK